jgi:hypothetical protein
MENEQLRSCNKPYPEIAFMRYSLLLALGALLVVAVPAVAQKTDKPAKPEKVESKSHPLSLDFDNDNDSDDDGDDADDDAMEAREDAIRDSLDAIRDSLDDVQDALDDARDAARDALDRARDARREAMETIIELNPGAFGSYIDSLESALGDSLENVIGNSLRITVDSLDRIGDYDLNDTEKRAIVADSLRELIRRQMASTRQIMGNARELSKEMRKQMQQMHTIRIVTREDTTGMARELHAAEQAIASARHSIQPLDSSMILFGENGAEGMRMLLGDSSGGNHVMIFGRNDGDPAHAMFIDGRRKSGVIVQTFHGDSSGSNGVIVRQYISNGALPTIAIANAATVSTPANSAAIPTLPPMPLTIGKKVMVLDADSINVVDGKDVQTIIRMSADNREKIIIITSRGQGEGGRFMTRTMVTTITNCKAAANGATVVTPAKPSSPVREDVTGYTLEANRPNPFSGSTTISFTLPHAEHVMLSVYDTHGGLVKTLKDEEMEAGSHSVMFDASGLSSGTYIYRLVAGGFNEAKTMTLEK